MFDFSKIGELSKMAGEAKKIQQRMEEIQAEQIDILKKISSQLEQVIKLLEKRG